MKQIKLFLWCFSLFVAFDSLWLGVFAKNFYKAQIGQLFGAHLYWPAAFAVWALLAAGLVFFVLPRVYFASTVQAFLYGAFYGLVIYGVYDLTNYAMLAHWPFVVTAVDIAWGVLINGVISVLACELARMIK
jgi:uncharacterized membrane protein